MENEKNDELNQNEIKEEEKEKSNEDYISKLDKKYNIKFYLLCQIFQNLIKAKTKSKVK